MFFLRVGKFDWVVYVGLPNLKDQEAMLRAKVGRIHILTARSSTMEMEGIAAVGDKYDAITGLCRRMAMDTEGVSGVDLVIF